MTTLDDVEDKLTRREQAKAAGSQEVIDTLVDAGFISKEPWWSLIGVGVEEQVYPLTVRASTGSDARAL